MIDLDNELKKLKNDFDDYLSTKPVFTEKDKMNIRKKISHRKFSRISRPKIIPSMLSSAVVVIFIFFIGNFLINELSVSKEEQTYSSDNATPLMDVKLTNDPAFESEDYAIFEETTNTVSLSPELDVIYQEYAIDKNDERLRGLSPLEIFQLYVKAELEGDYETQYWLYIQDKESLQVETVKQYVNDVKKQGTEPLITEHVNNPLLKEVYPDEKHAYIPLEDGLSFGFTKDRNGIWKVNWLPLQ